MAPSRFDYVQYTPKSAERQAELKGKFQELEAMIETHIAPGRNKALVMTKLEEAYMWCGKGLRDEQIACGSAAPLQEQRANS